MVSRLPFQAPVSGTTRIYRLSGYAGIHPYDPKRNIVFTFAGLRSFLQIAGPNTMLTDSDTDNWKACLVYKAGECWSGSSVGKSRLVLIQ